MNKKEIFYSNEHLKYSVCYINDSLRHGEAKGYYKTGELKTLGEYDFGKPIGWHYRFYKNKDTLSKTYFEDGLQQGMCTWYYKNGNIETKQYWLNGLKYGGAYFYYSNGSLKAYNCYDISEACICSIEWDSFGNKMYEEGRLFSSKVGFSHIDSIEIGDTLTLKVTINEPPFTRAAIFIGYFSDDNTINHIKKCKIVNWTVKYSIVFKYSGLKQIAILGSLKNADNNEILNDTLLANIHAYSP